MRALVALACLLALGCGRGAKGPGERPLETVEVAAQPDAGASLAGDPVEAPRADAALAGALPRGFPREVPLPERASVVDFGERSVTLEVPSALGTARADYLGRLAAAGFAAGPDGEFARGERRIGVTFADAAGATRITIEIR